MNIRKDEKGSITLFVLIACMFITITLLVVNIGVISKNRSQEKQLDEISKRYSQDETELANTYEEIIGENEYISRSNLEEILSGYVTKSQYDELKGKVEETKVMREYGNIGIAVGDNWEWDFYAGVTAVKMPNNIWKFEFDGQTTNIVLDSSVTSKTYCAGLNVSAIKDLFGIEGTLKNTNSSKTATSSDDMASDWIVYNSSGTILNSYLNYGTCLRFVNYSNTEILAFSRLWTLPSSIGSWEVQAGMYEVGNRIEGEFYLLEE